MRDPNVIETIFASAVLTIVPSIGMLGLATEVEDVFHRDIIQTEAFQKEPDEIPGLDETSF